MKKAGIGLQLELLPHGEGFRRVGMGLDVELPPLGEGSGRGLTQAAATL